METQTASRKILAGSIIIVLYSLTLGIINFHFAYDDAHITYRYSYNLATGHGLVYNVGDRYLGTSAPLYSIILGLLAIPNPAAIPFLASLLSVLGLSVSSLGLFRIGIDSDRPFAGFLAGMFFASSALVAQTFGGEMLVQIALIVWAFAQYNRERSIAASVLIAIAILIRPDAGLAAIVLVLHRWISTRRAPIREIGLILAVVVPFCLASWLYYGNPLPGTMSAKIAQGKTGLWPRYISGAHTWLAWQWHNIPATEHSKMATLLFRVVFACAIPGILAALKDRRWWPLLTWVLLNTVFYIAIRIAIYHWYLVPMCVGIAVLAALAIDTLLTAVTKVLASKPVKLLAYAILALLLLSAIPYRLDTARAPNDRLVLYGQVSNWLLRNTSSTASVGFHEIGWIGYHTHRRMIDPMGLILPGLATHIAQRDFAYAYEQYRPDIIMTNPDFLQWSEDSKTPTLLAQDYDRVASFTNSFGTVNIYRRKPSL